MHWFWRATIAVLVGCLYAGVAIVYFNYHEFATDLITRWLGAQMGKVWQTGVAVSIAWFLPVLLLAFGVYGLLTRFFAPLSLDRETRCRKCGYILRGISEPRCSECGERI